MSNMVYSAIALTGGAPGALDAIDGAILVDLELEEILSKLDGGGGMKVCQ